MRSYRVSVYAVALFALVYPLVAGSVLVRDWHGGPGEIYPIAPWALFCFVPNQEVDHTIRLTAIDGQPLEQPMNLEDLAHLSQHQKTVGRGVVQGMSRLVGEKPSAAFHQQRALFEQNYLAPMAGSVQYELVRREYDVLDRWRSGQFDEIERVATFDYVKGTQTP